MPYAKLDKPRACPLDLTHKAGARRAEWYVYPNGKVQNNFCAGDHRAKAAAKREARKARKAA